MGLENGNGANVENERGEIPKKISWRLLVRERRKRERTKKHLRKKRT